MSATKKYRDYIGSVEVCLEDDVLHGKILHIRDMVTYEADSPKKIQAAFEEAVDQYLADCEELDKKPNKPFSGTFNVRVGEELHRDCVLAAGRREESLNEFVTESVKQRLVNLGKGSKESQATSELSERGEKSDDTNIRVVKPDTTVAHTSSSISIGRRPDLKMVK